MSMHETAPGLPYEEEVLPLAEPMGEAPVIELDAPEEAPALVPEVA